MRRLASIFIGGVVVCACGGSDGSPLEGDGGNNSDGGSNDGNNTSDANQDVQPGQDSGSDGASCPDYCAGLSTTPTFCSDFDKESTPADWITVTSMGGAVSIVQSEEVSCPNGLEVTLPQFTVVSQNVADAIVTKAITTGSNITHVNLKLEVYLPTNDTMTYVVYFGVQSSTNNNSGIYFTHHADTAWFLTQNNFGLNVGIDPPPLTGAWNAMTLDVVFGNQSTDSVTLNYTGNDNMPHMITCSGSSCGTGSTGGNAAVTSALVSIGMATAGQTEGAFTTYYDNVVVKVE